MVALATAHPAKFVDAVARAIGKKPKLPRRIAKLMDMPEQITVLPNDRKAVQGFIRAHAQAAA